MATEPSVSEVLMRVLERSNELSDANEPTDELIAAHLRKSTHSLPKNTAFPHDVWLNTNGQPSLIVIARIGSCAFGFLHVLLYQLSALFAVSSRIGAEASEPDDHRRPFAQVRT